jgi:hypothetical protein
MPKRRRFKQTLSLHERLAAFVMDARVRASLLQPGALRDDLLKRVRQAETASHIEEWVNSPGLQPPR